MPCRRLADLRVVQTLSAGHRVDRDASSRRGRRSATPAAPATSRWPSGSSAHCSAPGRACSPGARRRRGTTRRSPSCTARRCSSSGTGRSVARCERRLAPFGVEVIGVGRARLAELPELLPAADAVVVLAPLTDATRGMVDAAFLARMRDGALLVNAGRGAVVDTDALIAELRRGRLRGRARRRRARAAARRPPAVGAALAITPAPRRRQRGGRASARSRSPPSSSPATPAGRSSSTWCWPPDADPRLGQRADALGDRLAEQLAPSRRGAAAARPPTRRRRRGASTACAPPAAASGRRAGARAARPGTSTRASAPTSRGRRGGSRAANAARRSGAMCSTTELE